MSLFFGTVFFLYSLKYWYHLFVSPIIDIEGPCAILCSFSYSSTDVDCMGRELDPVVARLRAASLGVTSTDMDVGPLLEALVGAEPRVPWRRLAVDEAEGRVVHGHEPDGVIEPREVEDGVPSGGKRRVARWVAGPVGDAAQLVGAGEGGEGDRRARRARGRR